MKANKKTLMAVKTFFENDACVDMQELIEEFADETKMLKIEDMTVTTDECIVVWGSEQICTLYDFVEKFIEVYNVKICNILDSFVGEDIDCLLESE